MKRSLAILMCLAAVEAFAITATKEYVDRKDALLLPKTNVVAVHSWNGTTGKAADSGAYAEAYATNVVSVTGTNYVYVVPSRNVPCSKLVLEYGLDDKMTGYRVYDSLGVEHANVTNYTDAGLQADIVVSASIHYYTGIIVVSYDSQSGSSSLNVRFRNCQWIGAAPGERWSQIIVPSTNEVISTNYYYDARIAARAFANADGVEIDFTTNNAQLVAAITNTVGKGGGSGAVSSVNGKTGAVVLDADDVGAYSAASGATLAGQVTTIGAHLNAEDARFVVTNYNSVRYMPEAYMEIKLPDSTWSRIWSEMTRFNYLTNDYLSTNYYTKTQANALLNEKADRAWGYYDSTTGAYAPDDYTWISSKKIAIAADLAYQRTITSEGAIWVLESSGTVTETGGLTNGFFRISDDEGNSLFEIVKGSTRTIGADADSIAVVGAYTPTKIQIGYSVESAAHPVIYVCQSLSTQNWKAESDEECIANVVWSGSSGAWVAQVQGKQNYSSLFVKATYEVPGETYISNKAATKFESILIGNTKYTVGTATISGHTVLTLTAQ